MKNGIGGTEAFLAHGVVGHGLSGDGNEAREFVALEVMDFEPTRVHADHEGEVAASRVTAEKDLLGVSALFGDVCQGPGDGRGGVFDVGWVLRFGMKTIVDHGDGEALFTEVLGDGDVPGVVFVAVSQGTSMEPNEGGEVFLSRREIEVKFATLVPVAVFGLFVIGEVFLEGDGFDLCQKRKGQKDEEEGLDCRAHDG